MKVKKPDIIVQWSKRDKDFIVKYSSNRYKWTGYQLFEPFSEGSKLRKVLEDNDYDLTTLKISISKKAPADTPASEL